MATIGGSVESCSIRARLFACAADADVTIKTGGFSNEIQPNGNGTARMVKTRELPSVEGLVVSLNHDAGDLQFLQEIADGLEFVDFTITLASGHTYQGKMQITEAPAGSTQSSTCELALTGEQELTLQ
jgi:hypothetical protein